MVLMFAGLVAAGCAHKRGSETHGDNASLYQSTAAVFSNTPAADRNLIVTLENGLNGKISSVNPSLRFVVLTFPVGQMPRMEQRLDVYRRGLKVAELSVTGPQRDDSIVADIVTGEVLAGDEVRDR